MTKLLKNQALLRRMRFAIAGIRHALRTEKSFATEAVIFALVLLAVLILRPRPVWCVIIVMTSGAVLAAELFNTALEHLADRLHPEEHPEIRIAKDCAAGAVLVVCIAAIVIALLLAFDLWSTRR